MRRPHIYLLIVLGLGVVWAGYELVRAKTGEAAPEVDYAARLTALIESRQPPGCNGRPVLLEAGEQCLAIRDDVERTARWPANREEDDRWVDFGGLLDAPHDSALYAVELAMLDRLRDEGVTDLVDRAAACPRMVDEMLGSPLLDPGGDPAVISAFVLLFKAFTAEMTVALSRGDGVWAAAAFERALCVGRALSERPFLMDSGIARAAYGQTLGRLRVRLHEQSIDETTARAMLDVMDRQIVRHDVERWLEGERAYAMSIVELCYTDDRNGDGRMRRAAIAKYFPAGYPPWLQASRAETIGAIDTVLAAVRADGALTPQARLRMGSKVEAVAAAFPGDRGEVLGSLPGVSRLLDSQDDHRRMVLGTRIMLGLAMHRERHGAYPETLDVLAPDFLPEVPMDPTHGGPFGYRRLDEGVMPYALYSTGLDGVDDASTATLEEVQAAADAPGGDEIKGDDRLLNPLPP